MQIIKYDPAKYGLGTESSQNLQPLDFSPQVINRFYNLLGDLEKRPGYTQLGPQIVSSATSPINLTNIHEYIDTSGNSTLFASGEGKLYTYNVSASAWNNISLLGYDNYYRFNDTRSKNDIFSVQMNDKLIFCNGRERNFYIDNPTSPHPTQLYSTITKGTTGGSTNSITLSDNDITNWKTQTNVAVNDLVQTLNTYLGGSSIPAAAVVTSVGTSSIDITNIGSSAAGMGVATINFKSGVPYRIIDLVELNIIPIGDASGGIVYDNVAVAGAATTTNIIAVTALNFAASGIAPGDYIYNTTRAAVTIVTTVSSNINIARAIAGQIPGDSLVFLKDSMPIATYPHVHYSQLYLIDARDTTKIRVSGPNDPEDFTTFSKTLASSTLDYGSRQPKGDVLLTMDTFQRYFVVGGQQNLYVIDGTVPIAEVTADVINLTPVGLFPQGVVSHDGLANIGGKMLYLGRDGLRSFLAAYSSNNTISTNESEQIKTQLIAEISNILDSPNQLQLVHYPRRNWVIMKIGENMYNYNYTPIQQPGVSIYQQTNYATITEFSGDITNISSFYVRRNGDLIMGSNDGRVHIFDNGSSTDNGQNIFTSYTSPWHTLQEGQSDLTLLIKDGRYIKPVFETFGQIDYTISVVAGYNRQATDAIIVTAIGTAVVGVAIVGNATLNNNNTTITNPKMPLRWRGEQAQLTITSDSPVGGDIINSYTLYGNVFGRR